MWRFILITFGFLGFAFWELSGGADYTPSENSLQARAAHPQTVEVAKEMSRPAATSSLTGLQDNTGAEFEIMLASIQSDLDTANTGPKIETAPETKAEILTQPETAEDAAVLATLEGAQEEVREVWPGAIELFEQQSTRITLRKEAEAAALAARDIRYVIANAANMRGGPSVDYEQVGRLAEGTEVAILQAPGDGWLELQVVATGETGWMADWLISDPAR